MGAVGYLLMLDQLGTAVKLDPDDQREKDAFSRATFGTLEPSKYNAVLGTLFRFTALGDEEALALYSLRCALAHDYSLFNVVTGEPGFLPKRHRFSLHHQLPPDTGVIRIPALADRWPGDFSPPTGQSTDVGIVNLVELGESVYEGVCAELQSGKLTAGLTEAEMRARYFLSIWK